jgi:methyl-accepting chemotaxis protein
MAAFGSVLFFLLPIGYLAVTQISRLSDVNAQIFNRDVGGIDAIKQAEVDQATLARVLALAALSRGDNAGVGRAEQDFQSLLVDMRASMADAYSRSIRANLRNQLQSASSVVPDFEHAAQDLFARAKAGDQAGTTASLKSALSSADQLREILHQASVMKKANVESSRVNEKETIQKTRTQLVWLIVLAVAFGLFVNLSIARSFSVPLKEAVSMLGFVERGDLTQRLEIDSQDEIGRLAKALNAALDNVRDVMTKVGEASRGLTTASTQLAKSADVMAGGAHEQAASLEQTSASLEQITATVRQNSDNARQASQFAMSSRDAAEKGGTVVHNAMDAMNEINDASAKIAAIIRVIDEIAFQTNLLAVNASVEAARAREHGKGFAVVATEVRTLAQRSGTAAKEIKALIGDSRRKVENGSTLVNRSGQTLTTIVASVKRVTDIVSEIAAASREQSTGIEQVNTAMMQMDRVMQSNSSQTEELSATANMLAANAVQLEQLIARFVVNTDSPAPRETERKHRSSVHVPSHPIPQPAPVDPAPATRASLDGLAANLGQSVSTAALDEEFEEF